jgi:hypothetical protein
MKFIYKLLSFLLIFVLMANVLYVEVTRAEVLTFLLTSYFGAALVVSMLVAAGLLYYTDWQDALVVGYQVFDRLSSQVKGAIVELYSLAGSVSDIADNIWDSVVAAYQEVVGSLQSGVSYRVPYEMNTSFSIWDYMSVVDTYQNGDFSVTVYSGDAYYVADPDYKTVLEWSDGSFGVLSWYGSNNIQYERYVDSDHFEFTQAYYDSVWDDVIIFEFNKAGRVGHVVHLGGYAGVDTIERELGATGELIWDSEYRTIVGSARSLDFAFQYDSTAVAGNPINNYKDRSIVVPLVYSDREYAGVDDFLGDLSGTDAESYPTDLPAGSLPDTGSSSIDYTGWLDGILGVLQDIWSFLNGILSGIYGYVQGIWDWLSGIFDGVYGIWDFLDSVLGNISSLLQSIWDFLQSLFAPPSVSLDLSPLEGIVIKDKFPFSLPWDLVNSVSCLVASPQVPRWEVPIKDEIIVIDFSQFEPLAKIVRFFVTITFVVSLIILTRRLLP